MAELEVVTVGLTGAEPVFADAAEAGDSFANDGKVFLYVKNGHAGAIKVTVDSVKECDQGHDHDLEITVPQFDDTLGSEDTGERMIGPFQPSRFNDEDNLVQVTYDEHTSVEVAAIRLP